MNPGDRVFIVDGSHPHYGQQVTVDRIASSGILRVRVLRDPYLCLGGMIRESWSMDPWQLSPYDPAEVDPEDDRDRERDERAIERAAGER